MRAEKLRFEEEPQTDVRFRGSEGRETFSGSERENLPDHVRPGVDYRDVRVDYTLATRLTERDDGDGEADSAAGSPDDDPGHDT